MTAPLDHLSYYRLPWTYADNGISWLEPTTACNLRCEGCYRDRRRVGHRPLADVRSDLEVFKRLRKSDCMSIAGGDPLLYPHIVELVRMIRQMGWKPIVNTNGIALDEGLLRELKRAGVFGFTFHIDTSQRRPRVSAETESELNDVRLRYAEMVARAGGIACAFNATISERTVREIPALVRWGQQHADIVHTMVFILYRSPVLSGDFDFYANGTEIQVENTYAPTDWGGSTPLMAPDAVAQIRTADPLYEPAAYLNGTARPDSMKWLLANRLVLGGETVGYMSPRFMELLQTFKHMWTGTYLAYATPGKAAMGRSAVFFGGLVDSGMRRNFLRMMGRTLRRPSNLFRRTFMQSLMIIQPVNIEVDGRQDMCDGCPDITVHEGKLVWSCRLEELNTYGEFLQSRPAASRDRAAASWEAESADRATAAASGRAATSGSPASST